MAYVSPEVVQEVKQMDLLTYLKNYEPYELVRFSGDTYTTRTHDSLKISNGRWMWWSRGIGGRSALDYLIKVRGIPFVKAVEIIAGQMVLHPAIAMPEKKPKEKQLLMPKLCNTQEKVITYLKKRGIDEEIIQYGIRTKRILESETYHNVIFVGHDRKEIPRYAAIRGVRSDFVGEVNGSDKNYSFCIPADRTSYVVHLFESAIDLLSYATLQKKKGESWRAEHLLSLAGVYQPAKEPEKSKVPAALSRYLKEHPEITTIAIHFDNDQIGRAMTSVFPMILPKQYRCIDVPPLKGKDYNDYLCVELGLATTKRKKKPAKEKQK